MWDSSKLRYINIYTCLPVYTHTPTSSSLTYNCCIVFHCMTIQFIYPSWWTLRCFQFCHFKHCSIKHFCTYLLCIWVREALHSLNNKELSHWVRASLTWLDTTKLLSNVVISIYTPARSLSFHYSTLSSLFDIFQLLNWVQNDIY